MSSARLQEVTRAFIGTPYTPWQHRISHIFLLVIFFLLFLNVASFSKTFIFNFFQIFSAFLKYFQLFGKSVFTDQFLPRNFYREKIFTFFLFIFLEIHKR